MALLLKNTHIENSFSIVVFAFVQLSQSIVLLFPLVCWSAECVCERMRADRDTPAAPPSLCSLVLVREREGESFHKLPSITS